MKDKLTSTESAQLLSHINSVLKTGKPWKDEKLHHPAGAAIAAVLTIGGMAKNTTEEGNREGFSTNGWQYDWWQEFTHNGKEYTLSGSGYYGGHSFHVSD